MTYADPVPTNLLFTCRLRTSLQIQRTEQNRVDPRVDLVVTFLDFLAEHIELHIELHLELVGSLLRFLAEPIELHIELFDALLRLCHYSFDRTKLIS